MGKKRLAALAMMLLALFSCGKQETDDNQEVSAPEGTVDMGIVMTREDGTKYRIYWAECNLGASTPVEYGDYYAWGELEAGKPSYDIDSYKWCNGSYRKKISPSQYQIILLLTKYCPTNKTDYWDGDTQPDGKLEYADYDYADDPVRAHLGGNWRTPTEAEWQELRKQCIMTVVTIDDVSCLQFVSKRTKQHLYLPAAGYRYNRSGEDVGRRWCYSSSTISPQAPDTFRDFAKNYSGHVNDGEMADMARFIGTSYRPVLEVPVVE